MFFFCTEASDNAPIVLVDQSFSFTITINAI